MRFCIIGAGFFGYHIASELAEAYPSADIEIFEAEKSPLLGAATINQCRLHMGFHYPRSGYTIYQSIMGFDRFSEKYKEFVVDVIDNLYAVHRDGFCSAEQYLAVMDSFSLPYEKVPVSKELFKHPNEITALLRVPEKSIDVRLVRNMLSNQFKGTLYTETKITEIDSISGFVRNESKEFGPYDYIINATYTMLNLGLPDEKKFDVKWELAALSLAETSLPPASAVTIMDGPFISVYPAYGGLHTLSSVTYTPFRKYTNFEDFAADYPRRYEHARDEGVSEKIGRDVNNYLNIDYSVKELWVTAKTKLATDRGDSRVTEVRQHGRLLSVLCGKLDAVFGASDAILKEI